jgi:5-methyltetrahydrofolate--homocysteine methyltransferase
MDHPISTRTTRIAALHDALEQRILVLDGAMGTMVQRYQLTEEQFRGERFRDFHRDLRGNNDLLTLTHPEVIRAIHSEYLEAGADILETNTFNSTSISQADYELGHNVAELNFEAAKLAREVADGFSARTPGKPRFVAGVLGPMNRTLSLSPDVNDPGFAPSASTGARRLQVPSIAHPRRLDCCWWNDLRHAEREGGAGRDRRVLPGGRHPHPDHDLRNDHGRIGRTLRTTAQAFWNAVRHARPLSVGFNCALGAKQLRRTSRLARIADVYVSAHPNTGLPSRWPSTMSSRARPRLSSRSGRRTAGSTSRAVAVAPRPITSARSSSTSRSSSRA